MTASIAVFAKSSARNSPSIPPRLSRKFRQPPIRSGKLKTDEISFINWKTFHHRRCGLRRGGPGGRVQIFWRIPHHPGDRDCRTYGQKGFPRWAVFSFRWKTRLRHGFGARGFLGGKKSIPRPPGGIQPDDGKYRAGNQHGNPCVVVNVSAAGRPPVCPLRLPRET